MCEVIIWVSVWYFCSTRDQKDMLPATEYISFTGKTLRGVESVFLAGGSGNLPPISCLNELRAAYQC